MKRGRPVGSKNRPRPPKTACPAGHSLLDPTNIKVRPVECLTCDRARVAAWRAKQQRSTTKTAPAARPAVSTIKAAPPEIETTNAAIQALRRGLA